MKRAIYLALQGLWILICAVPATFAAVAIASELGLQGTFRVLVSAVIALFFAVGLFTLSIALARALRLIT